MASDPSRKRAMVDATILVAGSCWPRRPYEILRASIAGEFQLVLCPYVVEQVRRVVRARFPAYVERLEGFLSLARFELVPDPSPKEVMDSQGLVRDRSDIPIVLAALNAKADYLISEDKDMTTRDATTTVLRQKLTVLLSGTFLREVMGWSSERLASIRHRSWKDLEL
jgi:predicted nucleic acid-binding protein